MSKFPGGSGLGIAAGIGAAVIVGGLIWYQAPRETPLPQSTVAVVAPPEAIEEEAVVAPATAPVGTPEGQAQTVEKPKEQAQAVEEPTPAVAPEAAEIPAPRFDEVRREPDGMTVIAGAGAPGAEITVLLDGEDLTQTQTDRGGKFATLVMIAPDGEGHILSLRQVLGDSRIVSTDQIILAPLNPPVVVATADAPQEVEIADGALEALADAPPNIPETVAPQAPEPPEAAETAVAEPVETAMSAPETSSVPEAPGLETTNTAAALGPETTETAEAPAPETTETAEAPAPETTDTANAPATETTETAAAPAAETSDVAEVPAQETANAAEAPAPEATDTAEAPPQETNNTTEVPAPETTETAEMPSPESLQPAQAPALKVTEIAEAPVSQAAPAEPQQVVVLKSSEEGVELLNTTPPEVMDNVAIDTISYSEAGDVQLAGRAQTEARRVQVYLDNTAIVSLEVDAQGRWRGDLPDVDEGIYTLRVDEVAEDGTVTSRVETPFQREDPAVLAEAAAKQDGPLRRITVQRGNTLWAIARERYGDPLLYVKVFEANQDSIRDPDLIYPGQVFDLPRE